MDTLLSDIRVRLARHLPAGVMRAVRPFLTVQFVIFMAMGTVNTIVSIATATLLDTFCMFVLPPDHIYRAIMGGTNSNFIIGYAVSIITSFFLNCRFTFKEKPTLRKFLRFPVSYIPNFIFQYIFVFLFTSFDMNRTAAYICAAVIGTPVTFAAMKLIVFRRRRMVSEKGD